MNAEQIVNARQATHGGYADHARCALRLKDLLRDELVRRFQRGQAPLLPEQRQSIEMICDKLSRIIAGDPSHRDHWDDIAGYAALAAEAARIERAPACLAAGEPE